MKTGKISACEFSDNYEFKSKVEDFSSNIFNKNNLCITILCI